ncbi:Uma2 family endonuclease [Nocardioides sp. BGMRC 2183]|nr:Uma2 family endonuclease [Nocardioides sp. BGMRC 2183]
METMSTPTLGPGHTRADFDALPDDGNRYELLEGEIVVAPSPGLDHQRLAGELYVTLREACPPEWMVLFAPFDVALAESTVVEPDLLVTERDRPTQRALEGPPLLAVEILSPSSRGRDQVRKKRLYEKAGVPSYWIVDPEVPSLTAWQLQDGRYAAVASVAAEEEWTATEPFAVTLRPIELTR